MPFNKGDRVRFSPRPNATNRTEQGAVVDVTQDRHGRTHYEVRRDADPSGPEFFFGEDDIEKAGTGRRRREPPWRNWPGTPLSCW